MRTLIFNGSPRGFGDTKSLIDFIVGGLTGEYKIVNAYASNFSPCIDCRYCWENKGCIIMDEMLDVYDYLEVCDNVLIASPIYFSELPGKLLNIGSRLQTYYCAQYFRHEELNLKPKKGAVVLVGGGDGQMDKAYDTSCTLLRQMNCREIHEVVCSHHTNVRPSLEDEQALAGARRIARYFNGG